MMKSFFWNRRWALWAYGVGAAILFSVYLQVQFTVILNDWYRQFYDLLQIAAEQGSAAARGETIPPDQLRSVSEFWTLLFAPITKPFTFLGFINIQVPAAFLWIAIPYVVVATATNFVVRHYGFRWRQAITEDYIPRWRQVDEEIEGASQRIQEDANRFARIIESLGLAVFRAMMTLLAFLPILWGLSAQVDIPILKDIPGSLVWAALLVTVGGMIVSWFVGYFLPGLEYNNQRVEAAFRKELVLGEDDKRNHAKPEMLIELFTGLRFNYFRLYLHYGYFDLWANLYGQLTLLTPLLMVGPGMFTGLVTFGLLNQINNAYNRVDSSFSIILDNWTTLTELRSIWKRLHEFEMNLDRFNSGKDVGGFEVGPDAVPPGEPS